MNDLSKHINKQLERKDRDKLSSYKDPLMEAIYNSFQPTSFMNNTEKMALRIEAEKAAKRIEEEANAWLKENKNE